MASTAVSCATMSTVRINYSIESKLLVSNNNNDNKEKHRERNELIFGPVFVTMRLREK